MTQVLKIFSLKSSSLSRLGQNLIQWVRLLFEYLMRSWSVSSWINTC